MLVPKGLVSCLWLLTCTVESDGSVYDANMLIESNLTPGGEVGTHYTTFTVITDFEKNEFTLTDWFQQIF